MSIKKKSLTDDNATTVGVLPIKLSSCVTEPTKRFHDDLTHVALELNRAKTAMVHAFQRWHEDNSTWTPEVVKDKQGKPYTWRGKPMLDNQPLPMSPRVDGVECQADPLWKEKSKEETSGLSKWLCPKCNQNLSWQKECPNEHGPVDDPASLFYQIGIKVAPTIATKLIASCAREVQSHLKSRMPPQHKGYAQYRWQAILAYEVSATSYRHIVIPTPCQDTVLIHDGFCASGTPVPASMQEKLKVKSGGALIRIPLFSSKAGRKQTYQVARLNIKKMSRGQHNVVRKIAMGKWKLSDSKLVYEEDEHTGRGYWKWALTYLQPCVSLGLDKGRVAKLVPVMGKEGHPFTIGIDGDNTVRPWNLGQIHTIKESYRRLDRRRKLLWESYRMSGSSGIKGHGRQRVYKSLSLPTRKSRNLAKAFVKKMLSEIQRFCIREDAGKIIYMEPGLFERDKCWTSVNKIPFDFTTFRCDLEAQCKKAGIVLELGIDKPTVVAKPKKKKRIVISV